VATNKGQFKKGVSGNKNGRPKNKPTVFSHVIVKPTEQTQRSGISNRDEWIPFGSNNLFPQGVAILGRRSPVHRGILAYKTIYVAGQEITTKDSNSKLAQYLDQVNGNGDSQKDVADNVISDFNSGGNGYVELVKDDEGLSMAQFHKDWTTARVKKTTKEDSQKAILFHPDWSDIRRRKKEIVEIPLYPEFKIVNGKLRSVLHFKSYEAEFRHYGLPAWVAAMDAAGIAYKTNKWNISRLDNAFASSGVLVVEGDMSPEDAAKFKEDFKNEFTGDGNQGKVMLILKSLGGGETKFTPTSSTAEGEWIKLHQQSTDDLVVAHLWKKSLSGIDQNTGFDTKRIVHDHNQVHITIIPFIRSKIFPKINRAIQEQLGFDTKDIIVKNVPPPSLLDNINPELYTFTWEARRFAGMEAKDDDPLLQEFVINNQKKPNVTANQSE